MFKSKAIYFKKWKKFQKTIDKLWKLNYNNHKLIQRFLNLIIKIKEIQEKIK